MFENYNISSIMVTHTLLDIGLPFSLLLMRVGFGLGFSCHSVCITNIFVSYQIITSIYKGDFLIERPPQRICFVHSIGEKSNSLVCVYGGGERGGGNILFWWGGG